MKKLLFILLLAILSGEIRSQVVFYQNSGIRIFPNPVAASFRIGSEQGAFPDGCTLNLSDVCGRTVKQLVLKDLQQEVLVADLEDGIYLLSLSMQGKTV